MTHSPDTYSVCIIIAAYNAEATIQRAIVSALEEPGVTEVIVVDDASTDRTAEIARACDDGSNRLNILGQRENLGPSAARNLAIAESRAAWIGVLDADDFFIPGRIKAMLSHAEDADFIADDMWQVAENNVDGPRIPLLGNVTKSRVVSFEEFVLSNVTEKDRERRELGFIKPLMRRGFLDRHLIRYREHMRLGEDFELYARALALGAKLVLAPMQGYVSVVRANSLSGNHTAADLRHLRDCGRTLQMEIRLPDSCKMALRRHYLSVDCRLQWCLLIRAVKNRNIIQALATFLRPPPVPFYLVDQLAAEIRLRMARVMSPALG